MTPIAEQLTQWPIEQPATLLPIPRSENIVFRIADAASQHFILRLHRPGYHDEQEVRSELDWIDALANDTDVAVPAIIPTRDGSRIGHVTPAGESTPRLAVLFQEHPGTVSNEIDPELPDIFAELGSAAAQCHLHVSTWKQPKGFRRPTWSIATMLGPKGIWGNWRSAPGLSLRDLALLAEAELRIHTLFNAYGADPTRFGLVHNDMRPSNFLWHEKKLRLIDFDDCGFAWFVADFAASVSWFESDPRVPSLFERWRTGYERHRSLTEDDIAMIAPALMARRMLLLAWAVSRADTDLSAAHSSGFARGTVALARRFLKGDALI